MLLFGNQKSYIVLFFLRHILNILDSIKLFGYNMEIKFDKDSLVAEQNNYTTKIVNAYFHLPFSN